MRKEQATQKANQATRTATTNLKEKTIANQTQSENKTFNLTFGSLTFTFPHEEMHNLPKQKYYPNPNPNPTRTHPLQSHTGTDTGTANPTLQINGKQPHYSDGISPSAEQKKQKEDSQRFLKITQATKEWQRAATKTKLQTMKTKKVKRTKEYRVCFSCQKQGHIQKHCRKTIKCFSCGRLGHKSIKCSFKTHNPLHAQTDHPSTTPTANSPQPTSQNMEPNHDRPPIGDIFCPPNQILSEENAYLGTVGLIILIRGSPFPNLPGLLAANLAETHGGHPTDYKITQASISPYIVTCRTTQSRDAIVRRGLYSMFQGQVQFAVHEWRPRFGMGYDPPSHQVWVKLVGLPLQAWTVAGITGVLQKFGHPLQILPFGRDADHYRSITALVDTNHPSRIPLAYAYREGDYTTQVDIYILAWRLWESTHFPPPPSTPPAQHGFPTQPRSDENLTTSTRRCPSSSPSSDVPSEPTIDLSSWSPRSQGLITDGRKVWKPKNSSSPQPLVQESWGINNFQPLLPLPSLAIQPPSDHVLPAVRNLHPYPDRKNRVSATENPPPTFHFEQLFSLLHASLSPAPCPIAIKPPSPLLTIEIDRHILQEAKRYLTEDLLAWGYSLSVLKLKSNGEEGTFRDFEARGHCAERIFVLCHKEDPLSNTVPPQPKKNTSLSSQAQSNSHLLMSSTQIAEAQDLDCEILNKPDEYCFTGPPGFLNHQSDSNPKPKQKDPLLTETSPKPYLSEKDLSPVSLTVSAKRNLSPPKASQLSGQKEKGKGKLLPTRRSKRLQTKQKTFSSTLNSPTKSKSQMAKLAFDLDSRESPLDASTALMLLQATGLQVNDEVEQMILEATEETLVMDSSEASTPRTPIHDAAPPLVIPGESMVL